MTQVLKNEDQVRAFGPRVPRETYNNANFGQHTIDADGFAQSLDQHQRGLNDDVDDRRSIPNPTYGRSTQGGNGYGGYEDYSPQNPAADNEDGFVQGDLTYKQWQTGADNSLNDSDHHATSLV